MKRQFGMTLLEVLVALAVFATAAVALSQAGTAHLNSLSYLEQKTFASWVASNRQAELMLGNKWPDLGKKNGDTELGGKTWYWRQEVVKTTDDKLRGVRIEVFETEKAKSPLVTLMSYQRQR